MFCHECQNVLDVDILLATHPGHGFNSRRAKPFPHHVSLSALAQSAKRGCVLCQLALGSVARRARSTQEPVMNTDTDTSISFALLSDDFLSFRAGVGRDEWDDVDHEHDQGIKLYTPKDDPISQLLWYAFQTQRLAADAKSEQCFAIAKYWLKTCLESHGSICEARLSKLPLRLIDTGHADTSIISIRISNGELGEWLTLSHCWGNGTHTSLTTKANISARRDGFQLSTIPKSFRDAVMITRTLGYRYLWIDYLCILQDCDNDWLLESVNMAEIYANSVLTICADAAIGPQKGIFDSSNKILSDWTQGAYTREEKLIRLPMYSSRSPATSEILASPNSGDVPRNCLSFLHLRAWAFQEKVLSRRRLHYTSHGLLWSCSAVSDTCSETRAQAIHHLTTGQKSCTWPTLYHIPFERLARRVTHEPLPDLHERTIDWWYKQINKYTNRRLTRFEDRFPALSGLAKEYSNRTGYQYRAGIWVEDFRRGLLWRSLGGSVDRRYSPSWSWAVAVDVDSIFGVYQIHNLRFKYIAGRHVELVEFAVENIGGSIYGQVALPAKLILRGLCRSLKGICSASESCYYVSRMKGWRYQGRDQMKSSHHHDSSKITLSMDDRDDSLESLWTRKDPCILQITRLEDSSELSRESGGLDIIKEISFGLVLERVSEEENVYRRIGLAEMPEDGSEELGWEMRTVTII